jgi:hypothetical protein
MEDKDLGGRPPLWDNPQVLQDLVDAYFKDVYNTRKTLAGLAIHLGIERKTLYNYKERDGFLHIIKNARANIEALYEERAIYDGQPAGVIFALKNMGWSDKTETNLSVTEKKLPEWLQANEAESEL